MAQFNEIIISLRKQCNLTQKQVAKILGIAERNYQKLEKGESLPAADSLLKLMDYYDIPVQSLLEKGIFAKKDLLTQFMPLLLNSIDNFVYPASDGQLKKFVNIEEVQRLPLYKQMITVSYFLQDIIVKRSNIQLVWKLS